MVRNFVYWICLLCFPVILSSQESEYLLQIQAFYLMPEGVQYQFAETYYENFDQEPSAIVLKGIPLRRSAQSIRLQFSIYSKRRLVVPDEVIFNGKTAADPKNLIYLISNPATWPDETPLKISLFSNRPALDHWIDIPIIWDGQSPLPLATDRPAQLISTTDLVAKGLLNNIIGPGHSIQVATSNKIPTTQELASFRNFGNVYYLYEPPFYKIRIGTFYSKQEALNQLIDIRHFQNGNYADAFYLYEEKKRSVLQASEQVAKKPQDYEAYVGVKGLPNPTASTARTPLAYDTNSANPNRIYYETSAVSIQLSVHVIPPNLSEYSYLKDLGNIYMLKDKNVYKLKIGPFPNKKAAEVVMPQLLAAGFYNAFIIWP